MSLRDQIVRRRLRRRGPIPLLVAMVTASAATLIGLANGLEPLTILWRATASALFLSMIVAFGLGVIDLANVPRT